VRTPVERHAQQALFLDRARRHRHERSGEQPSTAHDAQSPGCSHTNTRLSGASTMLTGLSSESATTVSVKPAGSRHEALAGARQTRCGRCRRGERGPCQQHRGRERRNHPRQAIVQGCDSHHDAQAITARAARRAPLRYSARRHEPSRFPHARPAIRVHRDRVPHEYHDLQRTGPLVKRLRESASLKNPPIVTQVGDGMRVEPRFVVLDGANRSTAARAAGWPHLIVQVVRYESPFVELHTWFHALTDDARAILEQGLGKLAGVKLDRHDRVHARALLARREALACVVLNESDVLVVHGGRTLHERNELLNSLVHLYQDRVPYTR